MIPISLVGCASTREERGSVLMEDVIVQRTTIRSTTDNPTPKKTGGVVIQGDNITIGTIIVNSPNAHVDNSTKIVQAQQNYQSNRTSEPKNYKAATFKYPDYKNGRGNEEEKADNSDNDFFRNLDSLFLKIVPSLIMMRH